MNGPLRYRNVTDSHQDNSRNQHNYKETTPPHGNNYHTNVGYTGLGRERKKEIIIRLNDSASVLNAEMTAIQVVLENSSETSDKITIALNTITRAIRDATSRLTEAINLIPTHTGIPGNENADQAAKRDLQLDRIHTTVNAITSRDKQG